MTRELDAFIDDRLIGRLREDADAWAFDYAPEWIDRADSFDLSPALARTHRTIVDGGTHRPVQWYFDNLLPEEGLRTVFARDARVDGDDAFGLLAFYGAESAGSLTLRSPDATELPSRGLRELTDAELSMRIRRLPRIPLIHDAPKRMSMAGAQHKLPIVMQDGRLYEPLPGEVSTHILKPDHTDDAYAHSAINEYFAMRLASALGLPAPMVSRRYVPEPVYIVERFDRRCRNGRVERRHAIDACQLLDRSRVSKYTAATVESLGLMAEACRVRAAARLQLFRWLAFNVLAGNADNHLKNVSFVVSADGIEPAPVYDLLCTAVYTTRAFNDAPNWPDERLAIALPGARTFGEISRSSLAEAGRALGLALTTVERELARMVEGIGLAARSLIETIELENASLPDSANRMLAGERRLLETITTVVIGDMIARLR